MVSDVTNTHSQYDANQDVWRKCRDSVEGQEAIHKARTKYLPKLTGQDEKSYDSYLKRTVYYNATARTLDGMVGLMFAKKPIIELPNLLLDAMERADQYGNELTVFAQNVAEDILQTDRVGVLVDYPQTANEMTVAQAQEQNVRPYLAMYKAEQITNWRMETINNQKRFAMVTLREEREIWEDEFKSSMETVYRVLDVLEGVYRQRLFVQIKDHWIVESEVFPVMDGRPMTEIPFFMITSEGVNVSCVKPPLIDLVNVNLSHYRTSADLEHAAHFTGLPTPVITGISPKSDQVFHIGSKRAWVLNDPNATAFFLEFTGQGLQALEERLRVKERHIATLGARMLADEKASAETAEAHQIKRQGENSALAAIAASISDGIAGALMVAAQWMGLNPDEVSFEINRDYLPSSMDAQMLQSLLMAWQQGAIAFSDLVNNLKKGEILDPERDVDELKAEVDVQSNSLDGLNDGEG